MLEFVARGQWLVVIPAQVVAECFAMGLMIFALRRGLIDHPGHREVHGHSNRVPEAVIVLAFHGLRGGQVAGLANPKTLQVIARRLIPPLVTRSGSGRA